VAGGTGSEPIETPQRRSRPAIASLTSPFTTRMPCTVEPVRTQGNEKPMLASRMVLTALLTAGSLFEVRLLAVTNTLFFVSVAEPSI